jgi:hypothetical protein
MQHDLLRMTSKSFMTCSIFERMVPAALSVDLAVRSIGISGRNWKVWGTIYLGRRFQEIR